MAGKKNRNRQRMTNFSAAVGNQVAHTVAAEQPVTIDDISASENLVDLETKKEQMIKQLQEKIEETEKRTKDAEEKLKGIKEEYENLKKEKDSIDDELRIAKATIKKADDYASKKEAEAETEYNKRIQDATKQVKDLWRQQTDELNKQHQDIIERESALAENQRKLKREERVVEGAKEELEYLKEDLRVRKERYDAANPEKIEDLEIKLKDAQGAYEVLLKRYQDLSERHGELQVLMDTVKTEVDDPDNGIRVTSMSEIVAELQRFRNKYEKLSAVYERYPDDAAIEALEEKARKVEALEQANESLERDRNRYREEVAAARNANKELEIVKQEIEATNALNEHLLQELKTNKKALESRTGDVCPALTKVDSETESDNFKKGIVDRTHRPELQSLREIVDHVKNFAGSRPDGKQLYYTDKDIRAFLAGMAVSHLIILQGMSGTGKSSLPRIFSEAISGDHRLIPVESSWRDRNELLGYYNDFNKRFNAKDFTIELYRSSKYLCQQLPTFIVLDEMNLARIEYYFSDFLAILQEPDHSKWLIELVPSDMRTLPMRLPESIKKDMQRKNPTIYSIWDNIEKSRQGDLKSDVTDEEKEKLTNYLDQLGMLTGAKDLIDGHKIRVTDNIWFVGTANRDESTFEISDKVYDRAQVVSLNRKAIPESNYRSESEKYISVEKLEELFKKAILNNKYKTAVQERLEDLDKILMDKFDTSFGNRILTQTIDFVGVYTAAGGTLEDALDYQISTKILRKVITSDNADALLVLSEATAGYSETHRLLDKRIREL